MALTGDRLVKKLGDWRYSQGQKKKNYLEEETDEDIKE